MGKRIFALNLDNNNLVVMPNKLGTENVNNVLNERGGGYLHCVAYANANQTPKAKREGFDLVKITDAHLIMGKKKVEKTTENEPTDKPKKPRKEWASRINYYTIQHKENMSLYLTAHLNKNKNLNCVSYYFDKTTRKLYARQWLLDNGYIYPNYGDFKEDNEVMFKFENIIYLK